MKKIFVIFVAIFGFGIGANAQCNGVSVKNVSATWGTGSYAHQDAVILYNGNDGPISVQVEVTFVNQDGSRKTEKGLFALRANSSMTPGGQIARVDSGWSRVDCDKSTIKITIIGG